MPPDHMLTWFAGAALPTEPFVLGGGVTITDPARWYASLRGDIAEGPEGTRCLLGLPERDLYLLRAWMTTRT